MLIYLLIAPMYTIPARLEGPIGQSRPSRTRHQRADCAQVGQVLLCNHTPGARAQVSLVLQTRHASTCVRGGTRLVEEH